MATARFTPAWPAVLTVTSVLDARSLLAAQVVSCVVGATNVVLLGVLAGRHLGPRLGLVAAGVAAVHPTLLVTDATGLAEPLFATCVLGALLLVDRGHGVALGAVLAAATLVRAEGALLALLVVGGVAVLDRHVRRAVVAGAVTALLVTPWIVRNAVEVDTVSLSTNAGPTLSGANCDSTWSGAGIGSWDVRCTETLGDDEAAWTATERDRAVEYASDHPARAPLVAGARLARTWGLWDPITDWSDRPGEDVVGRDRGWHLAAWVASLVLLPLAIVGGRRVLGRSTWALAVPLVLVSAVSVLVYGNARFRSAAEPVLVVLATAAIPVALRSRSNRPVRRSNPAHPS